MPVVALLLRHIAEPRTSRHAELLVQLKPILSEARPITVALAGVDPARVGLDPSAPADFDALVELRFDGPRAANSAHVLASAQRELEGFAEIAGAYLVHQRTVKDDHRSGQPTPGIQAVYGMTRQPQLTRHEFDQHWAHVHAPLAVRHHIGVARYVQLPVLQELLPGSPEVDAFARLQFRSEEDMRERSIDSPEGLKVIQDDIATFMGGAWMLLTREYVLT